MEYKYSDNQLMEALHKSEKEGGTAQVIKDDQGRIIGICGICQPHEHPSAGLFKALIKEQEIKND